MGDEFAQWQKEITPERRPVTVCFDRGLLFELEEAEEGLARIRDPKMLGGSDEEAGARARVDELKERVQAKSRTLVFASIGGKRWSDLLAEHPPTKNQQKQNSFLDHNPESFPAAAMHACCVEPGITLEQAQWLMDELPIGVSQRIWGACLQANVTGSRDPFGNGSVAARATAKS